MREYVGAYVVLGAGVTATEGLGGALCRVVGVEGGLCDVRRVSAVTGQLEGIEVRFLVSELRPVRPAVLRWHDVLRLRAAIAGWRRAVADGDEDVDSLALLVEAAELLAERVMGADPAELEDLAVGEISQRSTVVLAHGAGWPGGIDDVAARIDPARARYAVAGVCAALGRKFDWNADTLDEVREAVVPAAPQGCPRFFDQGEDDMAFWQGVAG